LEKRVFDIPKHIIFLSDLLFGKGVEIYLVGGYVRNSLLSLPVTDLDICSIAKPDDIASALIENKEISIIEKAIDFGTIQIDLNFEGKKFSFEHTTFRNDFYHEDGSHRPKYVSFTKDIKLDASRRDFTINAIYYNIEKNELIDPLGGIDDLNKMIIRAAKQDPKTTLSDDGLRILRMVRFAAQLNFKIDPDLFKAAKTYIDYLADISAERKYIEIKKIMLADVKYIGYKGAFNTKKHTRGMIILNQIGGLKYTFERLIEGKGFKQSKKYHEYDVYNHLVQSYDYSEPDLVLRFSALFHDVGKPEAFSNTDKRYEHDAIGEEIAHDMLSDLKAPKAIINDVCLLVKNHMFDLEGNAKPSTVKRKAGKIGFDNMLNLAKLRKADFLGSGKIFDEVETATRWEQIVFEMREKETPESVLDLEINGNDLIKEFGIKNGKDIGLILNKLFNLTLVKPSQNKRDLLLNNVKNIIKQGDITL